MEIIRQEQSQKHENGTLTAFEYPSKDTDMNGAVTHISGRYPETGWSVNEKCKELIYVMEGAGILHLRDREVEFKAGDILIMDPGEEYFWEGEMTHFVATTPPWHPEQHKSIA